MSNKYPCVYYDNGKCQKFSDGKYNSWCDFDQCEHQTPSNGDRIRAMSDEELEEMFHGGGLCSFIQDKHNAFCDARGACTNCVIEWLKQPYKEDT